MVNRQAELPSQHRRASVTDALVIAIWFGGAFGLVEAAETYLLRTHPAIVAYQKAGTEVFWVAPLANTILLSPVAMLLVWLGRFVPQFSRTIFIFGVLGVISWYGVLSYPQVIARVGVAMLSFGLTLALCRLVQERACMAFLRRKLVYVLLVVVAVAAGAQGSEALQEWTATRRLPAAQPNAPNVLLVVIDTLRADRLSIVGYSRPTTPYIDQIAREGVLFENAYVTASWTLPSHVAMLTGRFTYEHKADYPVPNVRHGFLQLPEVLAQHGYRTGMFSANLTALTKEYVNAGFLHYDTYTPLSTASRTSLLRKVVWQLKSRLGIEEPPKRAYQVNQQFLDWVDQRYDRPFFALLNYIDVHDHYKLGWPPPPPFKDRFGSVGRGRRRGTELSKAELDIVYDATVAYADAQIGWLLDQLRQRGLAENTLLIITSDHGESLWQHNHFAHQAHLYREGIHVPLIFWFPDRLPRGIHHSIPVSLTALPHTITDQLGLSAKFPGRPLPVGEPQPQESEGPLEEPLLSELNSLEGALLKSLVTSRWHYILNVRTGVEELFDLEQDPSELHTLAAAPEFSPVLNWFRKKMRAIFPSILVGEKRNF